MYRLRLVRHAACAAALAAFVPAHAADSVHLIHGKPSGYPFYEHTIAFPAGDYFALHCAQTCELKKNRVYIRRQTIKTTEGPAQGVVARSSAAPPSLFMVRGLPGLKEGPVQTWYYNRRFQGGQPVSERAWDASQVRRFDIGGRPLTVTGAWSTLPDQSCATDASCPLTVRVDWKVRFGAIERTLAVTESSIPELGTPLLLDDFVVWIGDIDGDGKPDLVVRPQERRDELGMQLFLSTELVSGKPWRPAARFYYWDPAQYGC